MSVVAHMPSIVVASPSAPGSLPRARYRCFPSTATPARLEQRKSRPLEACLLATLAPHLPFPAPALRRGAVAPAGRASATA